MISFMEGVVDSAGPLEVVLNINGIGYRIEVPVTTAEQIPGVGRTIRLHIHPVYREDTQALYGFVSAAERDFFRLLLNKVSGIGPKIGLSLMSRLSFAMLSSAIARGDVALLAKCPGIGKKTAERLCVELKDKLGGDQGSGNSTAGAFQPSIAGSGGTEVSAIHDAVQALITLGYKLDAADNAVRRVVPQLGPTATADALIKAALRSSL